MLSVSDCIPDHTFPVVLENNSGLFVDVSADSVHTTSSSKSSDSWLSNALDVISHDLSVSLSSSLFKTFSSFASSRHCIGTCYVSWSCFCRKMKWDEYLEKCWVYIRKNCIYLQSDWFSDLLWSAEPERYHRFVFSANQNTCQKNKVLTETKSDLKHQNQCWSFKKTCILLSWVKWFIDWVGQWVYFT